MLRYFFLQAHYRSKLNFTWKALESAQNGLDHLKAQLNELEKETGQVSENLKNQFKEKLGDDFNVPQAFALVSEVLKSDLSDEDKLATIFDFDKVLGLSLKENHKPIQKLNIEDLPQVIQELISKRNIARENKDWNESDKLRDKIESKGYLVKDTQTETQIFEK